MMQRPRPSGLALPSVMIILSLCALLQIFAWRQTVTQQRLQHAQWSSQQMTLWLESLVFMAGAQFTSSSSPLRWKSREAFDAWQTSQDPCATLCVKSVDFSHAPPWRGEYQIQVWPLTAQAPESPIFVYAVTATMTHTTKGMSKTVQAVWRSDEARWISWHLV